MSSRTARTHTHTWTNEIRLQIAIDLFYHKPETPQFAPF